MKVSRLTEIFVKGYSQALENDDSAISLFGTFLAGSLLWKIIHALFATLGIVLSLPIKIIKEMI